MVLVQVECAKVGALEPARFLMEEGAHLVHVTKQNTTAFDWALKSDQHRVVPPHHGPARPNPPGTRSCPPASPSPCQTLTALPCHQRFQRLRPVFSTPPPPPSLSPEPSSESRCSAASRWRFPWCGQPLTIA